MRSRASDQFAIERVEPALLGREAANLDPGGRTMSSTASRAAAAPARSADRRPTTASAPAARTASSRPAGAPIDADPHDAAVGQPRRQFARGERRHQPAADQHGETIGQPLDVAHLVRAEEHGLAVRAGALRSVRRTRTGRPDRAPRWARRAAAPARPAASPRPGRAAASCRRNTCRPRAGSRRSAPVNFRTSRHRARPTAAQRAVELDDFAAGRARRETTRAAAGTSTTRARAGSRAGRPGAPSSTSPPSAESGPPPP